MTAPLLMTVPQAADYLGRSAWWVRLRVNEGTIPARLIRGRYFVSRPVLDRWLGEGAAPVVGEMTMGSPSPKGARRVG